MLPKPREERDVSPSPSKTQEPSWCFSVSASDSQPFGVGGSREEKKKAGKRSPLHWECEGVGGQSGWTGKADTWDELSRREDGGDEGGEP